MTHLTTKALKGRHFLRVADWKPDGNMQGLLQHLRFSIGWGISERGEKSAHVS